MANTIAVGKSITRVDAWEKVTGEAKFINDVIVPDILYGKLVTSPHGHALIKQIDLKGALQMPGVQAIVTGEDAKGVLTGTFIEDRPPLAVGKVNHYGEPVAVVIATSALEAARAAKEVKVMYEPLPVINSPGEALEEGATLVHPDLANYRRTKECFPVPGTNIASHVKIRKGDMNSGWSQSEVTVEASFFLPQADHVALETRATRLKIDQRGFVTIHSTSQGPYIIRKKLSRHFKIDVGKITVHTPLVGGAFGGKAAVQLEMIALLASRAVGGKEVLLVNSRKEDMVSSPCRIGLEARVKLGATSGGKLQAAEITYLVDTGAYSDMGAVMTKSIASDCTGPYEIANVHCDALCVYTNHPYVTSYRGFGHSEYTVAIERTMDKLAFALGIDPVEIRRINAITPGNTTPTLAELTKSNVGNLQECLTRLKGLLKWEEGQRIPVKKHKVRSKGISCFWKTSSTPPNANSGAVITFSPDGYAHLHVGAVELGQGAKTVLAQILAERLKLDMDRINVSLTVNTQDHPEHWKTVASSTSFMVGNAVMAAADDALTQIKAISSIVLRCSPQDLEVAQGKIFLRSNPKKYIDLTEVIHGYQYPNGNSIGGQIIGRGSYIMKHLSTMDKETGRGQPGPLWTVGAQGVEVEFDTRDYTYKILKAVSVIDAGRVLNPATAKGVTMGGMSMGLSLASREGFVYNENGVVLNANLRHYRPIRSSEEPEFVVEFLETPEIDGPYGARGIGEHGLVGMPAALINSLSSAAEVDLGELPLTPEQIWKAKGGSKK